MLQAVMQKVPRFCLLQPLIHPALHEQIVRVVTATVFAVCYTIMQLMHRDAIGFH